MKKYCKSRLRLNFPNPAAAGKCESRIADHKAANSSDMVKALSYLLYKVFHKAELCVTHTSKHPQDSDSLL